MSSNMGRRSARKIGTEVNRIEKILPYFGHTHLSFTNDIQNSAISLLQTSFLSANQKTDGEMEIRMKQLSIIKNQKTGFGGSLNQGKRKTRRPLSTKKPMHLVLKSEKAHGRFSFSPSDQKMKMLIHKMAKKFGIKLYTSACNWSHVHLVIRIPSRRLYNAFIRALTGTMVLKLKATKGFFTQRPFSKIGNWGKQFQNWLRYVEKNEMQAWGLEIRKNANASVAALK